MTTSVEAPPADPRAEAGQETRALRWAAIAFAAPAAVAVILGALIAVVLPYGEWDAMAFGTWSRLIANNWPHIHNPLAAAVDYHRPLFYVLQGTLWHVFGFHQALGRLLSLAFSVLLLLAVAALAARAAPHNRRLAAGLALIVLVLVTPFERHIASGLSDVPVAAMVAVTAVVAWSRRLGRAQLPLVTLSASLAVLAKPSALPSLAGLAIAVLIGPRSTVRLRLPVFTAVGVGTLLGLVYDWTQARYVGMGLYPFLTNGTGGFYAHLADQARTRVLLDGAWLGSDLRILLWFALAYAVARLRLAHRGAIGLALPAAAVWSWLGPHLAGADGLRAGILGTGGGVEQVAVLVLTASLLFALDAPAAAIPGRLQLVRLLVWAAPTIAAWALTAVYDTRLLAPAWPPLVGLIALAMLPAITGAARRREVLVVAPALALLALGVLATQDVNGLGPSGWRQLQGGGLSGLGDAARMRNVAFGGDFAAEMNAVAPELQKHDRMISGDGRLQFFFQTQVDTTYPGSCSQIRGHRLFVLLESDEIRTLFGKLAEPAYWEACRAPRLTKVAERPGAFALFVTGAPHSTAAGSCGTAPTGTPGLTIEFGRRKSAAAADTLLAQLTAAGFVQAKIERLGCASFRIVETGIPSEAVGKEILAEARKAGVAAKLVHD